MFSNLASYLWGSQAPVSTDVTPSDIDMNPSKLDEIQEPSVESRLSPDALISLASSLSDEEADWVFVNNGIDPSLKDDTSTDRDVSAERTELLERTSNQYSTSNGTEVAEPTTRVTTRNSRNNTSALSADSALKALQAKVIRPEQKAQRRDRELRLKHKQLERTNLTRMVESSCNRPHKRRNRYTPTMSSRAVNNRKC